MKKNDGATRCKHCHKVIVGNGHMGLCDSCFNKDATKGIGTVLVGGTLWINRKNIGELLGKLVERVFKK